MPLTLNQRHKSSEQYFSLLHIIILFLQGEFNFKISPLSSTKAGPFPFLELLLFAPSLQPVVPCGESALPSCTRLCTTREGFAATPQAGESLGNRVLYHPWGPVQLPPTRTSGRTGRPITSPGKHTEGDPSCGTMGGPAQAVGLLSLLPAPSLVPAVPQFPFRHLPNMGVARNHTGTEAPLNLVAAWSWRPP